MRRALSHWLLAILLVFAQEVAVAHLAGHAAERLNDRQTTTHTEAYCPKCSMFASFGSSPPSTPLILKFALTHTEHFSAAVYVAATRTVVAYQSRAPPVLI